MFAGGGYGLWWLNSTHPEIRTHIEEYINSGSFPTLEVRYTAAQIMETHRRDLLKDNRHRFLEPQLKFYPYLMLEVKYNLSENKTREGVILWDLRDGEMVVDTRAWDKTHGFGDCINARHAAHEFKIINTLAKKGGSIDREGCLRRSTSKMKSSMGGSTAAGRKELIVQAGNRYRLHLQNPRLQNDP